MVLLCHTAVSQHSEPCRGHSEILSMLTELNCMLECSATYLTKLFFSTLTHLMSRYDSAYDNFYHGFPLQLHTVKQSVTEEQG